MSNAPPPILSSGDNDATDVYLFRARDDATKSAITCDRSGAILPVADGIGEWIYQMEFALGVREAMPIHVAPEPVLRGLQAVGYFVHCEGSNPKGTSQ